MRTDGTVFTETDQIGVYTVFVGDTPLERFTVNLLDATESALLPPATDVKSQPQRDENCLVATSYSAGGLALDCPTRPLSAHS